MPATSPSWTRRRFLGAVGGAGASLLLAARSSASTRDRRAPVERAYPSRPDLQPPNFQVLTRASGRTPGSLLITPNGGSADAGLMIIDDDGHLVWFKPMKGTSGYDLKVQELDGKPVLTWWEGKLTAGHGAGVHVIADTTYTELRRVPAAGGYEADLHDFRLTDRGTALVLAYQPTSFDLRSLGGPPAGTVIDSVVQEIDLAGGGLVFEWRGLDHVDVDESHATVSPDPAVPLDFLHLNSVEVDSDGDLLISARNTWTIYKVDRSSGDVRWRLGGKRSDFAMGPGAGFAWQHDARRQADGSITLFDDEADPPVREQSRGVVLAADELTMTANLARQYLHPERLLTGSQGNLQLLAEKSAMVGWGAKPRLTEFSDESRVVFDAVLPDGSSSYRAFRFPWTATPVERPAASVDRSLGLLTVHVSWNGATEVDAWRVLAGTAPDRLSPVTTRTRRGFETTITMAPAGPHIVVEALDRNAAVLAATEPLMA